MKEAEVKELMAICYKRGVRDGASAYDGYLHNTTDEVVQEVYTLHMMAKQEQEVEE